MPIGQGFAKTIRIKRQTTKGALATNTGGQIIRRESGTFEMAKEAYTTESEITSIRQTRSSRHGVKLVNGSIKGILSAGTYADPLSAVLRRDFTVVAAITGASITVAGAGPFTVARATGSFLTDGIKIGMVVRLSAGAFNVANLNKNLFVTNVTALVLTVTSLNGVALVAEGPIATATVSVPGRVTFAADSGQTNIYHTVEEFYSDVPLSERNLDVKFTQADLALPGSGNSTISFTATGLDQTSDTTAYFASPTAESTTESLAAANGVLFVNGAAIAVVTDLSVSINGNGAAADGVVGTNIRPDVFTGNLSVTGSFTAYFEGGVIPALFRDETATSIISALSAGSAANADFVTVAMSNVRINSSTPDDTPTGLKRTFQFVSIYNAAGGAALANQSTSVQIHDSAAA